LPHVSGVVVERVAQEPARVCIQARTPAGEAACPKCGALSRRVHGRYTRQLADTAISAQRVVLRLRVRRLFCDNTRVRGENLYRTGHRSHRALRPADHTAAPDARGDRTGAGRAGGGTVGQPPRVDGQRRGGGGRAFPLPVISEASNRRQHHTALAAPPARSRARLARSPRGSAPRPWPHRSQRACPRGRDTDRSPFVGPGFSCRERGGRPGFPTGARRAVVGPR
jgi:hypothetical protein